MANNTPSFSGENISGATMRPRYMGRTMTTYPVSEPEMEQISSLSGQVTRRFSVSTLLLGLAASIWINAIFYSELTPIAFVACFFLAPLLMIGSVGYAIGGFLARRSRASAWEKIKSDAEPMQTIAEAGGLMLTGNRPVTATPWWPGLIPATLNYREQLTPLWCSRDRRNGLRGERSVNKLPNGPSPINDAQRLRWGRLEGFVNAAEIIMRDVQRDRRNVVVQLL